MADPRVTVPDGLELAVAHAVAAGLAAMDRWHGGLPASAGAVAAWAAGLAAAATGRAPSPAAPARREWLTAAEAAAALGRPVRTVRWQAARGALRAVRRGRDWAIYLDDGSVRDGGTGGQRGAGDGAAAA